MKNFKALILKISYISVTIFFTTLMPIISNFTDTYLCFSQVFFLLTALTMLTREPHFPCRWKKNLHSHGFFVCFFSPHHFYYSLECRICISNYKTCTRAAETLQQNASKGPCTVPRCTAWLLIYFSRSLRQVKKAKTNNHLGKILNLTN